MGNYFTMTVKFKVYHFLLIAAILVLILSIIVSNLALDIHMHDTYFIISWTHIYWVLVLALLFFWILYLCMNQFMYSRKLSLIHIILTILTITMIIAILFEVIRQPTGLAGMPRRYYDYDNRFLNAFYSFGKRLRALSLIAIILTIGQIIFPINLIAGIIKRKRAKLKSNNHR
jgi:heme/copper-type cytochrome/quinol oxidase subunit 1